VIPLLGGNVSRTRKISLKTILDSGTVSQKTIQLKELFLVLKEIWGTHFFLTIKRIKNSTNLNFLKGWNDISFTQIPVEPSKVNKFIRVGTKIQLNLSGIQ
jgi:hypothetical protein